MKLEDFLVMIGLKLLVRGNLENTLCYTTPLKNSENSVMTQALIYLSIFTFFFTLFSGVVKRIFAALKAKHTKSAGFRRNVSTTPIFPLDPLFRD